ncbi:MAG TPA: hypothetical protein PKE30_01135 [Niabella sp.]|nr:hypothetical protein [Niabella sp.]
MLFVLIVLAMYYVLKSFSKKGKPAEDPECNLRETNSHPAETQFRW